MYDNFGLSISSCLRELGYLLAYCHILDCPSCSLAFGPVWLVAFGPVIDVNAANSPLVVATRFVDHAQIVVLESDVLIRLHLIVDTVMQPGGVQHRLETDESAFVVLQLLEAQPHLLVSKHDHEEVLILRRHVSESFISLHRQTQLIEVSI